jgi:RNA polymerase-binding transcription factor DksA
MGRNWLDSLHFQLEQEIRQILREDYAVDVDSETPVRYYLDFKSNYRLLELREALDRMDNGKFGICLACGGPIEISLLKSSPGVQFCESCLGTTHFGAQEPTRSEYIHHA